MWFRRKAKPDPGEAARKLRDQALTLDATELGIAPTTARPHVWAVLMETGYQKGVATLVSFADGTSSLYFSTGGGVLGAGAHATVRAMGDALLTAAETHLADLTPMDVTPLPGVGRVRFYVRTFGGMMGAEADERVLGESRHPLSPLFHSAHAVISAIRESAPEHER
jgi:hypothetical protein